MDPWRGPKPPSEAPRSGELAEFEAFGDDSRNDTDTVYSTVITVDENYWYKTIYKIYYISIQYNYTHTCLQYKKYVY